ncbi:MAG: fatty acid desaturase [Pirellulales bacterium]|nr:fatty acid desaturase [Pirellulales bacterium]
MATDVSARIDAAGHDDDGNRAIRLNKESGPHRTTSGEFSIAEARTIVKDLFEPNPLIYWTDLIVSLAVGVACFLGSRQFPLFHPVQILLYVATCIAYYRAALFTHELVHLRHGKFRGFRIAWNLLVGIPFFMPSFLYHIHMLHHVRKHYGTDMDGEYIPFAHRPVRRMVRYLAESFIIPALGIARFMVLSPLTWVSPTLRRWVYQHASSMIIDPTFIRPLPTTQEQRIWKLQEVACFLFGLQVAFLIATGLLPWHFLAHAYLVAVGIILLNAVRTLAAHRYLLDGKTQVTFVEQLLDSLNFPRWPAVNVLWAPVGLRFHALHHLFPSMPYHALGTANARLLEQLPADSPYRRTQSESLWGSLKELCQTAYRRHGF